jgi:WD40 repeat protein
MAFLGAVLIGLALVWTFCSGRNTVKERFAYEDMIIHLAISPDGATLATALENGKLRLWSVTSHVEVATLSTEAGYVGPITFSPDGRFLAVVMFMKGIKILDTSNWEESDRVDPDVFPGERNHGFPDIASIAYSPDAQTLAITRGPDDDIMLLDMQSKKQRRSFKGGRYGNEGVAFSPDGTKLAAAGGDGKFRVWDVSTGKEIGAFVGSPGEVRVVAFSPDGRYLIGDGLWTAQEANSSPDPLGPRFRIKVWDLETMKETRMGFFRRWEKAAAIAMSPNGKLLAAFGGGAHLFDSAGSKDFPGRINLWDFDSGKELLDFEPSNAGISVGGFSADGKMLISGGAGGNLHLWNVKNGKLVAVLQPRKE